MTESLSKRLFDHRLRLVEELEKLAPSPESETLAETLAAYGDDTQTGEPGDLLQLKEETIDILHHEVSAMNVDNFIVRPKRKHVDRFKNRDEWADLDAGKFGDLYAHVSGLPPNSTRKTLPPSCSISPV